MVKTRKTKKLIQLVIIGLFSVFLLSGCSFVEGAIENMKSTVKEFRGPEIEKNKKIVFKIPKDGSGVAEEIYKGEVLKLIKEAIMETRPDYGKVRHDSEGYMIEDVPTLEESEKPLYEYLKKIPIEDGVRGTDQKILWKIGIKAFKLSDGDLRVGTIGSGEALEYFIKFPEDSEAEKNAIKLLETPTAGRDKRLQKALKELLKTTATFSDFEEQHKDRQVVLIFVDPREKGKILMRSTNGNIEYLSTK